MMFESMSLRFNWNSFKFKFRWIWFFIQMPLRSGQSVNNENCSKYSKLPLGIFLDFSKVSPLQNGPSMTVALFKQCWTSKIHNTIVSGCPSLIRLDTSNHKPVSVTNDVRGQSVTGGWHQTPVSVNIEIIVNRHCYKKILVSVITDNHTDQHWYIRY
jgi:hypothetical protein